MVLREAECKELEIICMEQYKTYNNSEMYNEYTQKQMRDAHTLQTKQNTYNFFSKIINKISGYVRKN